MLAPLMLEVLKLSLFFLDCKTRYAIIVYRCNTTIFNMHALATKISECKTNMVKVQNMDAFFFNLDYVWLPGC